MAVAQEPQLTSLAPAETRSTGPPYVRTAQEPGFLAGVNWVALIGGLLAYTGGVLYAFQEIAYVNLAGATPFQSYSWVFAIAGIAELFIGLGVLLGFAGLEDGLPTIGGAVAFVGMLLAAIGNIGYSALRGQVGFSGVAWTSVVDAFGFLFFTVGLLLGFGGLAAARPERTQRRSRRAP